MGDRRLKEGGLNPDRDNQIDLLYEDCKKDRETRIKNYLSTAQHYYNTSTWILKKKYAYGFTFVGGYYVGESQLEGHLRTHHLLAMKLQLTPDKKCADLGCGVGFPMKHIAQLTQAQMTGVNINTMQLEMCRELMSKDPILRKICKFVQSDFCHMPFEDNSYDAMYSLQATCYAPSIETVLKEVYRCLKPGGLFGSHEFMLMDTYDDNNPQQRAWRKTSEDCFGIACYTVGESTIKRYAKEIGFEFLEESDMMNELAVPWYEQKERTANFVFGISIITKLFGEDVRLKVIEFRKFLEIAFMHVLEFLHLLPKGTARTAYVNYQAMQASRKLSIAKGAFNPHWFYLLRKPLQGKSQ